jgi:Holliday junction DNA helicase RuvA
VIGRLSGVLLEKNPPQILVDVRGVAYEVDVPMSTFYHLPQTGSDVALYTHLVVREDAHLLYGFGTEAERAAFRQLLRISGIGARTALAVLSGLSVSDLQHAVSTQDSGRLVKIPGIGKKTAERLLLELRDKLAAATIAHAEAGTQAQPQGSDVLHALAALGYSDKEAAWALKQVEASLPVAEAIRQCLRLLSKA